VGVQGGVWRDKVGFMWLKSVSLTKEKGVFSKKASKKKDTRVDPVACKRRKEKRKGVVPEFLKARVKPGRAKKTRKAVGRKGPTGAFRPSGKIRKSRKITRVWSTTKQQEG